MTGDAKDQVNEQIRDLEQRLLQPTTRKSRADLDSMLADDFIEFGSSGRVFDKKTAIASMLNEQHVFDADIEELEIKPLTDGLILATYKLKVTSHTRQRTGLSLRSSIWRFADGKWELVFHQGTPIPTTIPHSTLSN